jgi:hypothetical protein
MHRPVMTSGKKQAVCVGLIAAVAGCNMGAISSATESIAPGRSSPTGFQLTGSVVDREGKPLEGAFVLAAYYETSVGVAVVRDVCVKTRGMYTGADGQFQFPVEKLDVPSPSVPHVILSGYYPSQIKIPPRELQQRKDPSSYSGYVYTMDRQNPNSPQLRIAQDAYCGRTLEDAAAGMTFMELELREYRRLGRPASEIRNLETSLAARRAEFERKQK